MNETVLVIEENSDLCENIVEILEMQGYHVLSSRDDSSGYEMACRVHPGAIVCDLSSFRTANFIRLLSSDNDTRAIPLVFLDDVPLPPAVRCLINPSSALLDKPFSGEELLHDVARCFDQKNNTDHVA